MNFWDVFYAESLQSPWVIRPENLASDEKKIVKTEYAFIVEPGLGSEAFEMLSKMILAIKLEPDQVTLQELTVHEIDQLQMVGEPKKVLFFGNGFPGTFGQVRNWYGHQVVQSHKISALMENPELKKETWNHLKKYASLA